ncbi:glycosyltransferase family 2 protein [Rosenbergiella epipactidis]|uniref:glycosyltransferase family 2 protein n=1 Tax=Rosenbergiella epipactidis TaxID=1544694 RepID=UPI001F4FDEC1|nr:glycosyltransferase [Rosenbergiella epipactidis]
MNVCILIPTYNGGEVWKKSAAAIKKFSPKNIKIRVIDSQSSDGSEQVAKNNGFEVEIINKKTFNHGRTRNLAVNYLPEDIDIVIFLTQDAIPQENYVENIIASFADNSVACVYGRQLPHDDANTLARHARIFNYPELSHSYTLADIPEKGIKTAFTSNSFCAYRVDTFKKLKGFNEDIILSEDMYFAAKAILSGYKVNYSAMAMVKHSHNYTVYEEFKRYFDIGVFHEKEKWINESFGGAGSEGKKYLISEFNYILKNSPLMILSFITHNFAKLLGYKIGKKHSHLPMNWVKKLSMHKGYWR